MGRMTQVQAQPESDAGAAVEGGPGPLVSHFAGAGVGSLSCPLIIVPGGLSDEALARLN